MTDISLQPQTVTVVANIPTQIQAIEGGCTVINNFGIEIELCSDDNFSAPVYLPPGASIPWTTGTTLWALATETGTVTVLPAPTNYSNPNVTPVPATADVVLATDPPTASPIEEMFSVDDNVRTLLILVAAGGNPSVLLYGETSGLVYYNQTPYLQGIFGSDLQLAVVPIAVGVDTDYTIKVSSFTGDGTVTVYGDPTEYDESIYYNGEPTTWNLKTQGTLDGPCRLLSALLVSSGSACDIAWTSGDPILYLASSGSDHLTFPDDTLLYPGQSITSSASGVAQATVLKAYP